MKNDPASFQRAPAAVLAALVSAAYDDSITSERLQEMVRAIRPAVEGFQRDGVTLRDMVLTAHEDTRSPDHDLAKRIVSACNACKPFRIESLCDGKLLEYVRLGDELRDYAQAIRAEDLDGSEAELGELLASMDNCAAELLKT